VADREGAFSRHAPVPTAPQPTPVEQLAAGTTVLNQVSDSNSTTVVENRRCLRGVSPA
jgi:hypothetical protein